MSDAGVGLPWWQNRCPVVSNAPLHNALTLMIQPPPSHLGLQDSKHQLLERIPPPPHIHTHTPNCNMGQACLGSRWLVHIIGSAGQFPRMIIACNTLPGRGALACARICCVNLPLLEVRRPRGPRLTSNRLIRPPSQSHQQPFGRRSSTKIKKTKRKAFNTHKY